VCLTLSLLVLGIRLAININPALASYNLSLIHRSYLITPQSRQRETTCAAN
jgi:hypothetical protein